MPRWTFESKITLGNVITVVLALIPAIYAYAVMAKSVSDTTELVEAMSSRISVNETLGNALDKRTTVLEDSIVRGRQDRLEFQERTEALLEKLAEQMTSDRIVSAQVKTDVSYLRSFIEELKRERRSLE